MALDIRRLKTEAIGIAMTVGLGVGASMIPRVVWCEPYTIPSASMEPTLQVGDYVLIDKAAYGWSRNSIPFSPPLPHGRLMGRAPERGDIVVFKQPRDNKTLIKRLVGLPGDRIQVLAGVLRINGRAVPRQEIAVGVAATPFGPIPVTRYRETLPGGRSYGVNSYGRGTAAGNTGVYVVPAGCYFMMGDNRDNSLDSRFEPGATKAGGASCPWNAALDRYLPAEQGVGFVPAEDLVGRADRVLFSWTGRFAPWQALRWDRTWLKVRA